MRKLTALYIVLALLCLFFLIAVTPLTVEIIADPDFSLNVCISFIKLKLVPKKEKPVKLSDFRIDRFRKKRLKEEKKKLKKHKKADRKPAEKPEEPKEEKPKEPLTKKVTSVLDLVRNVVLDTVGKFGKYLKVKISFIDVNIGCEDPYDTAMIYGAVCQSVAVISELLSGLKNVKIKETDGIRNVAVRSDFINRKTSFRVHIAFSIRVWQIVSVGATGLIRYVKYKARSTKKKNKRSKAGGNTECQKTKSAE